MRAEMLRAGRHLVGTHARGYEEKKGAADVGAACGRNEEEKDDARTRSCEGKIERRDGH